MAKGGARLGAGRKPGGRNKRSAEIAIKAAEAGVTPLEFMLEIMRKDKAPEGADVVAQIAFHSMRFEAAKAAAPYVHPRLAAVEVSGGLTVSHEAALDVLK